LKVDALLKSRHPVKNGVQAFTKPLKTLDSGAWPGLDPGSAEMTRKSFFGFSRLHQPLQAKKSTVLDCVGDAWDVEGLVKNGL